MSSMMTAYKMTTKSGYSWSTDMAAGVTLKDAEDYFLGNRVNIGAFPSEDMDTVVKVEALVKAA